MAAFVGIICFISLTSSVNGSGSNGESFIDIESGSTEHITGLSTQPVNTIEIRGTVANEPDMPDMMPAWDAKTFAGFFYDFKNNRKTEYLNVAETLGSLNISRTIGDKNLTYLTGKAMVEFKVHEKEGLEVIKGSEFYGAEYPVVGWKGEKWIAIKGSANKLTRLVYEMDGEDKKTLSAGETWVLGSGYEITINAIDATTSPEQVWISLKKDGTVIDDGISTEKNVYYKVKTIAGESDALLFAVYVESIFSGTEKDMVQLKYAWLMDADSAIELISGDKFDVFTIKEAGKDKILLENDEPVNLSRNIRIKLLGDITLKTADSDELRLYPFVEYRNPGTYEIRGNALSSPEDRNVQLFWNGRSFGGLFYDFKNNVKTEYLNISGQTLADLDYSRMIGDNNLTYTTGKTMIEFRVHEQEGLNVFNDSIFYRDSYPVVGWKGEKWIAAGGNASVLTKFVYEINPHDKKTMSTGENWHLGADYELVVNAIDARTYPAQVWFSLIKNGTVIDDAISTQKSVYFKANTIKNEADAVIFAVYVDRIYAAAASDVVEFRYAWLTDADSAIEIKEGDTFDSLVVKEATKERIVLVNDDIINLSKNTEVKLLGDIGFRIADSDILRFYPRIVRNIDEMEHLPSSLSISINEGYPYSRTKFVTLSVYALNAAEMSFSNDDVNWSAWEPYSSIKSWKLSAGEGTKTVYFKARNAAGEAAKVSGTIILDTISPSVVFRYPSDDAVLNDPDVEIKGIASDISGIKEGNLIHIFGNEEESAILPANNSTLNEFSHNITLREGLNHIRVSFIDAAGNSGSSSINLTLDRKKPAVFINISGTVMANISTNKVLSVEYRNFHRRDPYSISIINMNDISRVYKKSGRLKGNNSQTVRVKWIPHNDDLYLIIAKAKTTLNNKTVRIHDIEIIRPVSDPSKLD